MGLSVFDFDKTLTDKDTLFGFYREVDGSNIFFVLKRCILILGALFYKLGVINNDVLKKIGVELFLKGKSQKEIQEAAERYAQKIHLNSIYRDFFIHTFKPDRVIISASFEEYLRILFPNENLIGSQLNYHAGKVRSLGRNMYGSAKSRYLMLQGFSQIDLLFTDSYADQSLMNIAKETFLIKNGAIVKRIE